MYKTLISALMVVSVGYLAGPARTPEVAAVPGPTELELHIGKNKYDIVPERAFTIVTPKGERVTAVIRYKRLMRYSADGLAFQYPRDMKVTGTPKSGLVVKDTTSLFVNMTKVQAAFSARTWVSAYVEAWKKKSPVKVLRTTACTRNIGGTMCSGKKICYQMPSGPGYMEVYGLERSYGGIALALMYNGEHSERADRMLPIILKSLR